MTASVSPENISTKQPDFAPQVGDEHSRVAAIERGIDVCMTAINRTLNVVDSLAHSTAAGAALTRRLMAAMASSSAKAAASKAEE